MRKTTSTVLVGLLGAGSAVALSLAVPGVAFASGCGTTTLTETTFPTTFSSDQSLGTGSSVVEDGDLRVTTTVANVDKASRQYPIANIPLASQTAESNYDISITNVSGANPGYNLVVDINGAAPGGYTTLVKEPGLYGDQFWTNSATVQGVPAGAGYAHLGTIQQYSDANPDAVIQAFGYSLGRGPVGDAKITKIRFGCNDFTFDLANRAPSASLRTTRPTSCPASSPPTRTATRSATSSP
jgi:hypothetical protein